MDELDVAVIGGGVVGLAVLRALARAGREAVLLEAERFLGSHTSSRNSEVIHAGIYYPAGSLKAEACVSGKHALYAYCEAEGVPHQRIGKLIVAIRDEELGVLDRLRAQARANGVHDLTPLSRADVRELEPAVECVGGVLSPSTGIIDSHAYMSALRRDAEAAGAQVVLASPVVGGKVEDRAITLRIGGADPSTVRCRAIVNSAGLWAQRVARSLEGVPEASIPGSFYAKGHYFVLSGRHPFSHLVYPVPVPGGLGVHVTLDMGGQARFGPDVCWIEDIDYAFDERREAGFSAAIRTYFPGLAEGALQPGYTGIRPKLGPEGTPAHDFTLQGPGDHGVPGLVNLYGIESPGLTASLALAERVCALL